MPPEGVLAFPGTLASARMGPAAALTADQHDGLSVANILIRSSPLTTILGGDKFCTVDAPAAWAGTWASAAATRLSTRLKRCGGRVRPTIHCHPSWGGHSPPPRCPDRCDSKLRRGTGPKSGNGSCQLHPVIWTGHSRPVHHSACLPFRFSSLPPVHHSAFSPYCPSALPPSHHIVCPPNRVLLLWAAVLLPIDA